MGLSAIRARQLGVAIKIRWADTARSRTEEQDHPPPGRTRQLASGKGCPGARHPHRAADGPVRLACERQVRRSHQHHHPAPASCSPAAQPGRERPAAHGRHLAFEPVVQSRSHHHRPSPAACRGTAAVPGMSDGRTMTGPTSRISRTIFLAERMSLCVMAGMTKGALQTGRDRVRHSGHAVSASNVECAGASGFPTIGGAISLRLLK